MKTLLAGLLMLGPWTTQADMDKTRNIYARNLYDCGIWIAGDVRGNHTNNEWRFHKNFVLAHSGIIANLIVSDKHDIAGICIDDGVENISIIGNLIK